MKNITNGCLISREQIHLSNRDFKFQKTKTTPKNVSFKDSNPFQNRRFRGSIMSFEKWPRHAKKMPLFETQTRYKTGDFEAQFPVLGKWQQHTHFCGAEARGLAYKTASFESPNSEFLNQNLNRNRKSHENIMKNVTKGCLWLWNQSI